MQQNRDNDTADLLQSEIIGLLDAVGLVPAEVADAQDVGAQRTQPRHEGRVVGRAEGVQDLADGLGADARGRALEAPKHLVPVGVIGCQVGDLAALPEAKFRHGRGGHVRVQRLVEGVAAEILGLVDGVGLADRDVENLPRAGDLVDRELDSARQGANDEVCLVLLDELQRPGRRPAGVELVVAHQELGQPPIETAGLVELLHGEFR